VETVDQRHIVFKKCCKEQVQYETVSTRNSGYITVHGSLFSFRLFVTIKDLPFGKSFIYKYSPIISSLLGLVS
jgi:hypothetical protein